MIRELLLPITETSGDANALSAASLLASRMEAHLCVLVTVNLPLPMPGSWGVVPDVAMANVHDELRQKARDRAASVTQQLAAAGISFEVRIVEALFREPHRTAALHARYSDLAVMANGGDEDSAAIIRRLFASLLMESGRPVLVVPSQCGTVLPIRHAVVAWRPTSESSRALHDAIALLRLAATVDVVEVQPIAGETNEALPGADIAAHLARHGLRVRVVVHPRQGESVSAVLLTHAAQSGAQLLVAGGYGHSRLRQWALGGVTRDLLRAADLPVLFSH